MGISPIAAADFLNAVQRIWRPLVPTRGAFTKARIGLCISGGPDSMALAFLCSRILRENLAPELQVTGFIVDHKARPESTEEAHTVSKWLEDMGLKSEILSMQWPQGKDFAESGGFETEARNRRYQLLAEACKRHRTPFLLTGHHVNDHIETVLMRMSDKLGPLTSLEGIGSVKPLPCSSDIYGTDPRGSPLMFLRNRKATRDKDVFGTVWDRAPGGVRITPSSKSSVLESQGRSTLRSGILLIRPLLNHTKNHLVATCVGNSVPFVSDPTNIDPAYTRRNACRHLISSYTLPKALQSSSILALSDKASKEREEQLRLSNLILQQTNIDFDVRTGTLWVQFPAVSELEYIIKEPLQTPVRTSVFGALDRTINRLIDVVNPISSKVNGVKFDDIMSLMCFHDVRSVPPQINAGWANIRLMARAVRGWGFPRRLNDRPVWIFSRRTPSRQEARVCMSLSHSHLESDGSGPRWTLWDGRYWIRRLHADSRSSDLNVRFLKPTDIASLRPRLSKLTPSTRIGKDSGSLKDFVPHGPLRYTIAVVCDGDDNVVCIPTLGISLPDTYKEVKNGQYEIQYKAVDPVILSRFGTIYGPLHLPQ